MKVLAEIPARPSPDPGTGTLRRSDLEAYRGLLAQLEGNESVLLTGPAPGRRLASVGLATAAVAAGRSAALLECELEDPGLADALGLANAPGLSEYLSGAAESDAILKPVVLAGPGAATAAEPLVCVVGGRPSSDGPRLFDSVRFAQAVGGLRAAHDLLVLDGPSLDQWGSLTLAMRHVDATVACLSRADSQRRLPVPVAGVVVQA